MKRWMILMAMAILLIAPASAILNVKDYNAATNTITIKDWMGLSSYETVKFISENYGLTDMEVIQDITPAQDMTPLDAFGKIEFISALNKDFTDAKIKYDVIYEVIEN